MFNGLLQRSLQGLFHKAWRPSKGWRLSKAWCPCIRVSTYLYLINEAWLVNLQALRKFCKPPSTPVKVVSYY